MKLAAGNYFSMYDEAGYESIGISGLDIIFLFPESYSLEECEELYNEIETKTLNLLKNYMIIYEENTRNKVNFKHQPDIIQMYIEKELDYLDLQIFVKCA